MSFGLLPVVNNRQKVYNDRKSNNFNQYKKTRVSQKGSGLSASSKIILQNLGYVLRKK